MCATLDLLRPFQSTIDLDGTNVDQEVVQDIAYDGNTPAAEHQQKKTTHDRTDRLDRWTRSTAR